MTSVLRISHSRQLVDSHESWSVSPAVYRDKEKLSKPRWSNKKRKSLSRHQLRQNNLETLTFTYLLSLAFIWYKTLEV